jgi:hypothetical protein
MWHIPAISALRRLRQEDLEFQDRLKLKTTTTTKNKSWMAGAHVCIPSYSKG